MTRPAVTVVLPFVGDASEARDVVARLASIAIGSGDRVLLVDNGDPAVATRLPPTDGVEVIDSPVKRSAYGARNAGAELAATDWILFLDADCRPDPGILDAYFDPLPAPATGAVGGRVEGTPGQPGLAPEWARSRRLLDNEATQRHPHRPMAVTANLLVRRDAWAAVGGFAERTRSGADADFCWRLADAGWDLEHRHGARVTHDHRPTLRSLLAQSRRDGAGATWLARRHPGFDGLMHSDGLARGALGALAWPLLGQPRRGLFKALDGLWGLAGRLGAAFESNRTPEPPFERGAARILLVDEWPRPGDPLVEEAGRRGVRVEARRRPDRADWPAARAVAVSYWEDDSPASRLGRPRGELLPPARRLGAAARGATLLADPVMLDAARRLVSIAGRDDVTVCAIDASSPGRMPIA